MYIIYHWDPTVILYNKIIKQYQYFYWSSSLWLSILPFISGLISVVKFTDEDNPVDWSIVADLVDIFILIRLQTFFFGILLAIMQSPAKKKTFFFEDF